MITDACKRALRTTGLPTSTTGSWTRCASGVRARSAVAVHLLVKQNTNGRWGVLTGGPQAV
jgi:hypothetical protein